jgi:pantetheine-phosphate adenylyltransferase
MKTTYIYPGTFCPPTYGHLDIVRRAAAIFPELTIVCSQNPDKKSNLFSPAECRRLWQYYNLPKNVRVATLAEFLAKKIPAAAVVMIRGIRNEADFDGEKKVLFFNQKNYRLDKFFYLVSRKKFRNISSSRVRNAVRHGNTRDLTRLVSPLVLSETLEKFYGLKRLYVAVGRPASGKSTILKKMARAEKKFIHVETDELNHRLKTLLEKLFPGKNLIELAIERGAELSRAIKKPWLQLIFDSLTNCPSGATVFLEIPYALQPDKKIYRFLGGRIIYFGCRTKENYQRNQARNTAERRAFIELIPDLSDSRKIAEKNNLALMEVDTSFAPELLAENVKKIINLIKGE